VTGQPVGCASEEMSVPLGAKNVERSGLLAILDPYQTLGKGAV